MKGKMLLLGYILLVAAVLLFFITPLFPFDEIALFIAAIISFYESIYK